MARSTKTFQKAPQPYVKKKKRVPARNEEEKIQTRFIAWFDKTFPGEPRTHPPGGHVIGYRRGKKVKRMGYMPGTSDFIWFRAKVYEIMTERNRRTRDSQSLRHFFSGLHIEFKTEDGEISNEQRAFHEKIVERGAAFACVCRSFEEARSVALSYAELQDYESPMASELKREFDKQKIAGRRNKSLKRKQKKESAKKKSTTTKRHSK